MIKHPNNIARVTRLVIHGTLCKQEAAGLLNVSERTIHNYVRKYIKNGPTALVDRRRGHFRKINCELEMRILAYKLERPYSSARWVRDKLKLHVSAETVRLIFLKHRLTRRTLGPTTRSMASTNRWEPF
jgi:transposase